MLQIQKHKERAKSQMNKPKKVHMEKTKTAKTFYPCTFFRKKIGSNKFGDVSNSHLQYGFYNYENTCIKFSAGSSN